MLLLDSQVALWLVDDNPRLGSRTRLRIGDADIVYVSAGTIWELTIKAMLGKLALPADFNELLVSSGRDFTAGQFRPRCWDRTFSRAAPARSVRSTADVAGSAGARRPRDC